jgi:hypothetical protein
VSEEIIPPFSDSALKADINVFGSLMQPIKQMDSEQHTVVIMQVEKMRQVCYQR